MIEPLHKGALLTLDGTVYTIEDIMAQNNGRRYVYRASKRLLFRGESHGNYYCIIKEILPQMNDQAVIERDRLTNQAVFHGGLSDYLSAEEISAGELLANYEAIQDKKNVTNSDYVFLFNPIGTPDSCAAYFIVDTVSGCTFAELPSKWKSSGLSVDRILAEATNQMIHAVSALQSVHEKGYLHLDIKPSNLFAVGEGHYSAKILDFGSAVKAKSVSSGPITVSTTAGYRSSLMKEICGCCSNGYNRDLETLAELCSKISLKDDLCALSKVFIYLLTGTTNEKNLKKLKANRYCMDAVYNIVHKAHEGGKQLHMNARCISSAEYEDAEQMAKDLKDLLEALSNKGVSKTVMLKKGKEYVGSRKHNRRVNINPEMLPTLRDDSSEFCETAPRLADLLKKDKRNIYIRSDSGSGKSYMLYDAFDSLSDSEDCSVVPVYIPLGDISDSKDCVWNFIAEKYTGIESSELAEGESLSGKLKKLFGKPDYKAVILADSLNEIPGTETKLREYAVNNLMELSKYRNISVVVTSKYSEIMLSDFDQYHLEPLDTALVSSMVDGYEALAKNIRELLTVPFNLSLYLGLSEESRKRSIKSAVDLIKANLDVLGKKLFAVGYGSKKIDFILGYLLPMAAYRMSRDNIMTFSEDFFRGLMVDSARRYSDMISLPDKPVSARSCADFYDKREADLHSWSDRYADFCGEITRDPVALSNSVRTVLVDNGLFHHSAGALYDFGHQTYRDFLACEGWRFTAESFRLIYHKEGESLTADDFAAPVETHSYLKEFVRAEDAVFGKEPDSIDSKSDSQLKSRYFDYLFDNTTRGILNSRAASGFNALIVGLMKHLYLRDEEIMPMAYLNHDFSRLDLSAADFCGTQLDNCSFSDSIMYSRPFGINDFPVSPDWIWNDDKRAVVLYKIGYIRTVFLHSTAVKDKLYEPFDAFYVNSSGIYLLRNGQPEKSHGGYIRIGEISEHDIDTLEIRRSGELSIPKRIYYEITSQGAFKKKDLSKVIIRKILINKNGLLLAFTLDTLFCFDSSSYGFLFYNRSDLYEFYPYSVDQSVIRHGAGIGWEDIRIITPKSFGKYIVLSGDGYLVLRVDADDTGQPIRIYGPFTGEAFEQYGRILDIRADDNGVYAEVLRDTEIITCRLFLETGQSEPITLRRDENTFLIDSDSIDYEIIGSAASSQLILHIPFVSGDCDLFQYYDLSIRGETNNLILCFYQDIFSIFSVFITSKLIAGKLNSENNKAWDNKAILSIPFYSFSSKMLHQFDEQTLALLSPNRYYYDFFEHHFVHNPVFHGLSDGVDMLDTPKYFYRYFDSDKDLDNLPDEFPLYKDSLANTIKSDEIFSTFIEDNRFIRGTKLYTFREKLNTSLKRRSETMFIGGMQFVRGRYFFACAVRNGLAFYSYLWGITIDTFLVLDLHTDRLFRFENPYPYEYSRSGVMEENLMFADIDIPDREGYIDHVFLMRDNHILELSFDLNRQKVDIDHDSELFAFVKLHNCDFTGVDIKINPTAHKDVPGQEADEASLKQRILRSWEENNITD